jgi:hypothetical protein
MLRAEPRDVRDVMIAATNGWIVALDNLSSIEPWLSDCLCRLATGGGFATRELYSDSAEIIFSAQRPVVLNGIEEIISRTDLLDRSILVALPLIKETARRPASIFWRAFEAARPQLLGGLLDAVSTALRREPDAHHQLKQLPRMADFAIWATAAAPALCWKEDSFINAYTGNRELAHEAALDTSPVAAVIRSLAEDGSWSGTAAELLETLVKRVDEVTRRARTWPKTPRQIGASLRRLAPNLRAVGVYVEFQDRRELGSRRRQLVIQKVDASERSQRSDRSSAGSEGTPPFPGNAAGNDESRLRNNGNDGSYELPLLSNDGRIGL